MKIARASQPSLRRRVAEFGGIVDRRVAAAQPPEEDGPERTSPTRRIPRGSIRMQQRRWTDGAVARGKEGVQNVAAIELADGQQVHGGGEHADPGGARHGVQVDIGRGTPGKMARSQQPLQQRNAEMVAALRARCRESLWRRRCPMASAGQQKDEPGERPGDADIEERPPGIDGRPDPDEGAEGSEKRRRQKIGQAGIHAVEDGGHVVAELVGQQNQQQRERIRQALQEGGGMIARSSPIVPGCAPDRTARCVRNRSAWRRPPGRW